MSRRIVRRAVCLAALALSSIALAACGSSNDNNTTSSSSSVPVTASKDASDRRAGAGRDQEQRHAHRGRHATYPPNEFIKPGTTEVIGMDADLAKALGQVMGLNVKVVNANFDSILPGLAAKKYDLGMSSFTDTKEREKTVRDFVTYFSVEDIVLRQEAGRTSLPGGLADLCEKTVAAEKGTTQAADATARAEGAEPGQGCREGPRLPGPERGQPGGVQPVRAQIGMADSPVVDYLVKKQAPDQFKLVGASYGPFPYGIAMNKDTGLAQPVWRRSRS